METSPLLIGTGNGERMAGLSVFFSTVCIVDIFGVLPMLTLPKVIIQCGWLGILVVLFVNLLQIYTAILLGKCWILAEEINQSIDEEDRHPYAALTEKTFGKRTARLVTFFVNITVFGAGIPNLLIASHNLQMIGLKTTDLFHFSFCYWLIAVGIVLCPFMWLGSPKDMKIVCSTSVFIVLAAAITTWICMLQNENPVYKESDDNSSIYSNLISAYGVVAFQFDVHPVLLTIQVDMIEKSKISYSVIIGFLTAIVLFTVTGFIAFSKYGSNVTVNVLQIIPSSNLLYFTILLVTLQLCLTTVIGTNTIYQQIEEKLKIPKTFNYKRCILRSFMMALAILLAESVPRFDLVMELIGGIFTGPLVFILPPLLYMKMVTLKNELKTPNPDECALSVNQEKLNFRTRRDRKRNRYENSNCLRSFNFSFILPVLVLVFGVVATVIAAYNSVQNTQKRFTFSTPCICNVTAATIVVQE